MERTKGPRVEWVFWVVAIPAIILGYAALTRRDGETYIGRLLRMLGRGLALGCLALIAAIGGLVAALFLAGTATQNAVAATLIAAFVIGGLGYWWLNVRRRAAKAAEVRGGPVMVKPPQQDEAPPRRTWLRYAGWSAAALLLVLAGVVYLAIQDAPATTGLGHDAPELEARLPTAVRGRQLTSWSQTGHHWLTSVFDGDDAFEVDYLAAGNELTHLRFAFAGRSRPEDPPYFVTAISRTPGSEEYDYALFLMMGAAGVEPEEYLADARWDTIYIGETLVRVGTASMLPQDEHQRGKPYFLELDAYAYLIVTDDEPWAREALGDVIQRASADS
jgi:hypothetical protein